MTAPSIHEEEVLGKAYDARLMRRLLTYVRPYRGLVAASVTLLMIDGALQLVGPMLTRRVIDVAIPRHDPDMIVRAAILFLGALAAQFACSYGETLLTALLGQKVMRDLRLEIFTHLQRLSIAFFDRNPVGRLITRVTSDVESLNELFTAGVVAGMGDLFTLLAISVLILVVDWRLALSTFAVLPFVWIVSRRFQVSVRAAYRDIRVRLARINAFLQERLTGMRIVQLFGREADEARSFDALNQSHLDAHLKSITFYALYFPAIELLTTVATASLIVSGAARVHAGVLTVGTVAAFLQLVRRFFQPLQDLSDKYNTLQQAMASSERVFRLLDTERPKEAGRGKGADGMGEPEAGRGKWYGGTGGREAGTGSRDEGARAETQPSATAPHLPPPPSRSTRAVTVAFDHVWFAYDAPPAAPGAPAADPVWVLKDVSFTARPGETLALVGHTGAGKTTIVSLLMRFYDPQRGRITINGRDVRDMSVEDVRALIGYVQQDIFLFAGDVAGNIRLSAPLSDDEVVAAAKRVGADRVIRRFAGGYAHELGERGASISVGERQLLSFARAIAADPALLLLDEATSAVDSEIEAEIQSALQELMRGRTTIAVAHRLSTIVGADEILVLHHGEVLERGAHRALLTADGHYARLWRLQAGERSDARETTIAS